MQKYFFLLLLIFAVHSSLSAQGERIYGYHTDIVINQDRSITVTEEIKVNVLGKTIKRGITRDLPQSRSFGKRKVGVKYEILSAKKNGEVEPYHEREMNGSLVLYFGSEDVFLTPGTYFYELKYRVPNQIAFFENYDEIYWNAVGDNVQFSIDSASCRVHLPKDFDLIQEEVYTGKLGQKGKDYSFNQDGNVLQYTSIRPLKPGEAFTVAVGFEKGYATPPSFFHRYGTMLLVIFGFLLLIPYYIYTWFKYGQDPATPASYPIWESPNDLSAASTSFIQKERYQQKSFTASVIDLAVKGYLKIEEVEESNFIFKSKNFDLIKLKDADSDLPIEEAELMGDLFRKKERVSIDGQYDSSIEYAYSNHREELDKQHGQFVKEGNNHRLAIFPIVLTVVIAIVAIILLINSPYAVWLNVTTLIVALPVGIVCLLLYGYLIEKPTVEKLDLQSRIKGFQMYMEMAEADRLNLLNPPEYTPEHFEAFLPFAFALGVEHRWTEKFESILKQAQYQPEWHNSNTIYFSNNFGKSFGGNVRGSTTKPSQSGGGSGGGGFSGGGGGGGGVGGW